MLYQKILSFIAIAITFIAFIPYIYATLFGDNRPHVFSWIIWGLTTFIVFLAQLEAKGGVGAWPIGVSACITLFIALLAYLKRADVSITRRDWYFFLSALSSLPLWYFTSDPVWAVLILTLVDILGFGPTIRKVYNDPYSESLLFFSLFASRNLIVIMALEHHSVTTIFFPATVGLACLVLISITIVRRKQLKYHDAF